MLSLVSTGIYRVMTVVNRTCVRCSRPLSRYNNGNYCGSCERSDERADFGGTGTEAAGEVGKRLKALRQRRGMSLKVVAGLAGVSAAYLSMLETGKRPLDRYSLIRDLAEALRVSPNELAPGLSGQRSRIHVVSAISGKAVLGPEGSAALGSDLTFPEQVGQATESASGLWSSLRSSPELSGSRYSAAAAAEAGWRWLFDPEDTLVARAGSSQVTVAEMDALRACSSRFSDLDRQHGGGYARVFLAEFLTRDVAPLLRKSYSDAIGRELFAVAAELTGMAAFMSYDIGDHGRAEMAFIQALRLAKGAGDRLFGAHILANMATQAVFLQLPHDAVRLSQAAIDGAGHSPPAAVLARLGSTRATASATAGDLSGFRQAIGMAQDALATADDDGPTWAGYFTSAHLAGSAMRSLLDLRRPREALAWRQQALGLPQASQRTRALHTALTALAYANDGQLDEAAHWAQAAVQVSQNVQSRRVRDRLAEVRAVLGRYAEEPAVAQALERLAEF